MDEPDPGPDDTDSRAPHVDGRKLLKVRVPEDQRRRLHDHKDRTGTTLSQAVTAALARYFDDDPPDA